MAVAGIGCDIIKISRIQSICEKHGSRFLNKVYHPQELKIYQQKPGKSGIEYLAGRWAAKEAARKALSPDFLTKRPPLSHIRVGALDSGKPALFFEAEAKMAASRERITRSHLTISHDTSADVCMAVVVLERI